jgi:hypothetical protein
MVVMMMAMMLELFAAALPRRRADRCHLVYTDIHVDGEWAALRLPTAIERSTSHFAAVIRDLRPLTPEQAFYFQAGAQ